MSESHQYFSMGGFPYQFLLFKASRRLKSFDECCLAHTSAPKEQNPGHRITKQMLSIHLWERMKSGSGGFSHVLSRLNCRLAHLFVKNFTSWWGCGVDFQVIKSPQLSLLFKAWAVVIARTRRPPRGWHWDAWVSTEAPEDKYCHCQCHWNIPTKTICKVKVES